MNWQEIIVIIMVVAAAGWLLFRLTLTDNTKGCAKGCGGTSNKESTSAD